MTSPVSAIEAIEKAMEVIKGQADRHYCNALGQFEKTPCLGAEFKMREGLFGRIEHEAHASANKAMGHHFGMYEAIRQLEPLMREVLSLARQAEALQRENAELREALKPFAAHKTADGIRGPHSLFYIPNDHPLLFNGLGNDARATVTVGDIRRARALLGGENAE